MQDETRIEAMPVVPGTVDAVPIAKLRRKPIDPHVPVVAGAILRGSSGISAWISPSQGSERTSQTAVPCRHKSTKLMPAGVAMARRESGCRGRPPAGCRDSCTRVMASPCASRSGRAWHLRANPEGRKGRWRRNNAAATNLGAVRSLSQAQCEDRKVKHLKRAAGPSTAEGRRLHRLGARRTSA